MTYERIVVVKKQTDYERLTVRYSSGGNAAMALSSRGSNLETYAASNVRSASNIRRVQDHLPKQLPSEQIDFERAPLYAWAENQIVVLIGGDGLFVNVAKYITTQPVICINDDPVKTTGVVMKHKPDDINRLIDSVIDGTAKYKGVTLGKATTNDGQELLAVNDFMVGRLDHRSARYVISMDSRRETQSSSGVLVGAPLGASGWMSSVLNGSLWTNDWGAETLMFYVREPFKSVSTGTSIRQGVIQHGELSIQSEMPEGGVIFSDGMMETYLEFTTGTTAKFSIADRKVNYVL